MLRKVIIGIVVVLVLLVGAVAAVPFIFKDKLVALAKEEINKQVNATVDFGDFDVSIFRTFPDLSLTINDILVINKEPFAGDTLANLGAVSVTLDIMSVIKGEKIDVKGVSLNDGRIYISVLEDGAANYDIAKPSDTPAAADTSTGSTDLAVSLQYYEITNTNIFYEDKSSGLLAVVENLNHTGKGDFTLDVFDLATNTTIDGLTVVSGGTTYLNRDALDAKLDLGIDLPNSKYVFKDNTVALNDIKLGFDGWVQMPDTSTIDMDVTFQTKETSFLSLLSMLPAEYKKDLEGVKTSGSIALTGFAKGAMVGEKYPAFGVNLNVKDATLQYPDVPVAISGINIKGDIGNKGGSLDNTVIDIPTFNLVAGKDPVSMSFKVATPMSDPDINATVKAKLDLSHVKDYYPLEPEDQLNGIVDANIIAKGKMSAIEEERYQDFQALGQLNIADLQYNSADVPGPVNVKTMLLTFSPQFVRVDNLDMKVGRSDFKGNGRLDNLLSYALGTGDEDLSGSFNVTSGLVDLNEFMVENMPDATQQTEKNAGGASEDSLESGISVPAGIDFTLDADMGQVLYDNMDLSKVKGRVIIKDETVTLQKIAANVLDGSISMDGTYSTKNTTKPKVNMAMGLNKIDIQQAVKTFVTMKKVLPIAELVKGKFSTNFTYSSLLNEDLTPDYSTMLADGRIDIFGAELGGSELLNQLADKLKMPSLKKLDIPDAWTIIKVTNGKVLVEPFTVTIQGIAMNIYGYNAIDGNVEYNIMMDVPREKFGAANTFIENSLNKSPIPGFDASDLPEKVKVKVAITGTVTKPKLEPTVMGGSGATVKDAIMDELQRQKDEAERKAKEELQKQKDEAERKAKEELQKQQDEAERKAKEEIEKQKQKIKDRIGWP